MKDVTLDEMNSLLMAECGNLAILLVAKNTDYNNSLHREPILFPMDSVTGIKARINDKLNRIKMKGLDDVTEDSLTDLIGYLIHLKIAVEHSKKLPNELTNNNLNLKL